VSGIVIGLVTVEGHGGVHVGVGDEEIEQGRLVPNGIGSGPETTSISLLLSAQVGVEGRGWPVARR
jgi:hypothetical protein